MKWRRYFCSISCFLLFLPTLFFTATAFDDITGTGSGGNCSLSLSWIPFSNVDGDAPDSVTFSISEGYLPFGPTETFPYWRFGGGAFEITAIPRDGRPLDLYCSFTIGFTGTNKKLWAQFIGSMEVSDGWTISYGETQGAPVGNSTGTLGTLLIFHVHTDSWNENSRMPLFSPLVGNFGLRGNPLDYGPLRISNVLYHSSRGGTDSTSILLNQLIELNQKTSTISDYIGWNTAPSSTNNILTKLTSIYQRVNVISNILPGFHSLFSTLGDVFSYDKIVRAAEDNSLTITPSTGNFWQAVVDLLSSVNADAAQKAVYEERAQEAGALDVLDSAYDTASGGGFFSTLGSMFGIFDIVDWDSTNVENGATSYGYDWFSYKTKEDLIFTPLKKGSDSDSSPSFWDLQLQEIRELGMDGGGKR